MAKKYCSTFCFEPIQCKTQSLYFSADMQFPKLDPFYIFIDFYLVQLIDYAIQRKLQAGGVGLASRLPPLFRFLPLTLFRLRNIKHSLRARERKAQKAALPSLPNLPTFSPFLSTPYPFRHLLGHAKRYQVLFYIIWRWSSADRFFFSFSCKRTHDNIYKQA